MNHRLYECCIVMECEYRLLDRNGNKSGLRKSNGCQILDKFLFSVNVMVHTHYVLKFLLISRYVSRSPGLVTKLQQSNQSRAKFRLIS